MSLHRPATVEDALLLLSQGGRVLAGGTDLYPALRDGPVPDGMVDVTGVAAMKGIARDGTGWRIGAATTWTEVLRADLPPAFDGLRLAAREVGSVQIQNTGTVAGNLCNASPAADGVPALLTLGASVEMQGAGGTRRLPLQAFIRGPRQTALQPGELVTALHLPEVRGQGAFLKLGARRYLVISIAMVAARVALEAGRIAEAAVAVGACSPVALRLTGLEAALTDAQPGEIAAHVAQADLSVLTPIDDVRASAAYRGDAVRALIARTLTMATESTHVA
ncbi:FAD binding domain-containing protein [Ponticoccus alexandrii]|uniref:Xanthine dehydrogenase family protein subunit M n=1 Tax=Ponticoccus alexandrii TaxID=1943633 RepID=A0ABX7F9U1_9RHOB|nr:xanthine dehydrogenase family protein subunit M [Ponticoccus alexandrii]ETA50281.1 xanthine dehydrogenase [Rhodobacteraceae bacterium PD-2]QRF67168.1 xanthine dehydrogenase family protein subunit M [Ponticoccus alexandrii]